MKAYSTYGTSRINAYKIIEETLNLKDVRIFDYIEDDEGRKKAVLNKMCIRDRDTETVEIKVNDGKPIENKLIYGSVAGKKIDENGEALGGRCV